MFQIFTFTGIIIKPLENLSRESKAIHKPNKARLLVRISEKREKYTFLFLLIPRGVLTTELNCVTIIISYHFPFLNFLC